MNSHYILIIKISCKVIVLLRNICFHITCTRFPTIYWSVLIISWLVPIFFLMCSHDLLVCSLNFLVQIY